MTLVQNHQQQLSGNRKLNFLLLYFMKTFKLFFLLIFLIGFTACGQQKKYISYTVKQGETIKSIAKKNGIRTKTLLRLNPDVSRRPSANTVIIIPNKNYNKSENSGANKNFHTVLKGENLFTISQKYGITIDAIKKINNLTGDNLSEGRTIQIPAKTVENTQVIVVVEEVDSNAIIHTVVKDDTVFNLTRKYGITKDELFGMNPALKDGLQLGMNLKVGEKALIKDAGDLNLFIDSITSKPLNIVLMLPYKLNTINDTDFEFKKKNSLLNIVTDFHSGALIAVDSLRRQGMRINLRVMDTENSFSKISSDIKAYNFDDVDAIIGPLFLKNAEYVSKRINGIPVIAPIFSNKQINISDNNLVKVAPNKKLLEEKMVSHILENYQDEKIIVVGDNTSTSSGKILRLISDLKSNNKGIDVTVLKPKQGYISKDRFIAAIDTIQKKNWVILVSDNGNVTSDVVNNLGVMPLEKRDIQLFSFDKGDNFKDVSNTHLARLKFTFSQVDFIDVLSVETRSFQKMFKAKNHIRPSEYANKGFDVMYDTLLRLSNADDFNDGAKQGISTRVTTKFDYSKRPFGSTENKGVFIIQYQENLELLSLN